MHIRAGANGSVGFVKFREQLFLETLDLQTSRVSQAKLLPPGCPNRVKSAVLAVYRPLPVFPDKQTFSAATPIDCSVRV
jgi:hypothetical protein